MAVQTRRKLFAWAILAVLCGALFALVRKPKYKKRLMSFLSDVTKEVESDEGTNVASGTSETNGSSDDSQVTVKKLPDEKGDETNEEDDQTSSSSTATTTREEQNQTNDTNHADQKKTHNSDKKVTENSTQGGSKNTDQTQGSGRKQQASEDNAPGLDLSNYDPVVRKKLTRAKRFYLRARKHNERVKDKSLSSERRLDENSKARTNSQRSLNLLRAVKKQMGDPDKAVMNMMDQVRKIHRKSFRRAKMWGGY